jgi:hypothetical protein
VARARWRRRFALSLALRLLARIVLFALAAFFACVSAPPRITRICHLCLGPLNSAALLDTDGRVGWQ